MKTATTPPAPEGALTSTEAPASPDAARRDLLKGMAGLSMAAALGGTALHAPAVHAASKTRAQSLFTRPPNFLVLVMDDVPTDGYNSTPGAMTVVSSRYKGGWLNYKNASCNDPLCGPGRAAILSGLTGHNHNCTTNGNCYNLDFDSTWILALHNAGYVCGGYGKLINGFGVNPQPLGVPPFPYWNSTTIVPPGFDDFHMVVSAPGYLKYTLNDNGVPTYYGDLDTNAPGTNYSTDVSRYQILDFLAQRALQPNTPWVVYWAPNAPHQDSGDGPIPAARYRNAPVTLVDSPTFNAPSSAQRHMPWLQKERPNPMTQQEIDDTHAEHTLAMRSLMAVDESLRTLMDRLDAMGQLDQTVIMLMTDNGHMYGSWGLQDKGTSFEDALNLQLRIRMPGVANGIRTQAVSNIDIAALCCELAGATMPKAMDGESFAASLTAPLAPFRPAAVYSHWQDKQHTPSMDGLRYPGRKITRGRSDGSAAGQAWAHNLMTDPWELKSIKPTDADLAELERRLSLL